MASFLTASIDRAIVMTQYDLRGFAHPLGVRIQGPNPKSLHFITQNFIAFAAVVPDGQTPEPYVKFYSDASFEQRLTMCRQLAASCDSSQKEAIQLIVKDIVAQSEEMKNEVAIGKRELSDYLQPLDRSNPWGMTVLALVDAFEVTLEYATTSVSA